MYLINTEYKVETPEGVDLTAELAGPIPRILAFIIDISIRFGVIYVFYLIFQSLNWTVGPVFIAYFLLEWFYPTLFEVLYRGQTPGKRIVGLVVVNDDLTPVSWNSSIIRNFLRTVDFLPVLYVGGLITMIINPHYKRLGDLSAGTIVVYKNRTKDSEQLPKVKAIAPNLTLELEDQVAIVNFTQRHSEFSSDRAQEIANILEPIHGLQNKNAVNHLHGLGKWYLGGKD